MDNTAELASIASALIIPPKSGSDLKRKRSRSDKGIRKRVSQACDACRSKKLKCNGLKPACSSCIAQVRECVYGTLTKKRGLPEGYVRGLERLLALLISQDGAANVNSRLQRASVDETTKRDLIKHWNGDIGDGETLAEIWRGSQLCKAFEKILPELDAPDAKYPDSKKSRLEPYTIGVDHDPSTMALPSLECQGENAIDSSKIVDGVDIEPPQLRSPGGNDPNHSHHIAVAERVPAESSTVSSSFSVPPHIPCGVARGTQLPQSTFLDSIYTHRRDPTQPTLPIPDNLSRFTDEFCLDLNFNDIIRRDDLFFEMSNLDHLYANLSHPNPLPLTYAALVIEMKHIEILAFDFPTEVMILL